jgi:hypothetical protein
MSEEGDRVSALQSAREQCLLCGLRETIRACIIFPASLTTNLHPALDIIRTFARLHVTLQQLRCLTPSRLGNSG